MGGYGFEPFMLNKNTTQPFRTHLVKWMGIVGLLSGWIWLVYWVWVKIANPTLTDYLRFAAVCGNWKSIQKNRRLRFSPLQLPMSPSLPWFMPAIQSGKDSKLLCSSFNHTKYYLQGFDTPYTYRIFSCHGWIFGLISGPPYLFTLVNPITTVKIHLPSLPLPEDEESPMGNWWGAMSGPPSDPDCTILLADGADVFLCRLNRGDDCWTHLDLPLPTTPVPYSDVHRSTATFSGGSFYCFAQCNLYRVIDPAFIWVFGWLRMLKMIASGCQRGSRREGHKRAGD